MKLRTMRHVSLRLACAAMITVLGAGQEILHHALGQLLAAVVIAAGSFALGLRRGRRRPGREATGPGRADAALRRQIAELEALSHRTLGDMLGHYREVARRPRTGGKP